MTKKKAEETAVATTEGTEAVALDPQIAALASFAAVGADDGFEDVCADTMAFPFIRILQDISPAVKKRDPGYVEGAEAGMFHNTVTNQLYEGSLRLIVGKFQREFLEWKPNRGGLAGVHSPASVMANKSLILNEKNQLMDPNNGNIFSDTYTYYCILPDHPFDGIVLLSCQSTQLKAAKKMNRILMNTFLPGTNRKALPYFLLWEMSLTDEKNDQGSWYGVKFTHQGFVDEPMLQNILEARGDMSSDKVDYNTMEGATGTPENPEVLHEGEGEPRF